MKQQTEIKLSEIGRIPEEWEESKIGDCIELIYGKSLPERQRKKGNIPVFGSNGIIGFHDEAIVKCPGIIIGRKGSVGEITFSKQDFWPIDTTYYVQTKQGNDTEFWYYFLKTLMLNQMNTHSAVPGLNRDNVYEIVRAIPNFIEQLAIASILVSLDDKIALNRQMNTTLEAIGQVLFKHWFVDFEFPDGEGKPYRSSGGEMVETELGEVPRGWKVMTVGEILELAYGKPLKDENRLKGKVPVYGSNGQIGWHNEKLVEGPGIVVGRKGNPGIVTWSHKAFFPIDTTFYVVPKNIRSMYYLFYILLLQDLQSLGADSAVPGLNRNVVYMNKMVIPSPNVLELFDIYLREIYNKVQVSNEESEILTAIRDALLPKLMSGEIRVK
ncbi:MAG: restriction endonuclease subunit S [Candidatus Methanoperedens sp.]|nr:restriction endonuclease subunit S [Candidatus Methanoperedens sp.]